MQTVSYATAKYVVLHGHADAPCTLVAYKPPSKISTGQSNVEPFDDPQAAIARAIELGVPALLTQEFWPSGKALDLATTTLIDHGDPVPWTADGTYARNSLVTKDGATWLHISDKQGAPDDTFDLAAGTGDWVRFFTKEPPPPPPELPLEEKRIAALEARLAALEAK